jgi:hypothetical protein
MPTFDSPADDITSREAFDDVLATLIRAATREDVDVLGGYRVDGPEDEEFGIEIYRVARGDD